MPPRHDDVALDALGLVESIHRQDLEAGMMLLDQGSPRLMASFLAMVVCDLIEATEDPDGLVLLRRYYASP